MSRNLDIVVTYPYPGLEVHRHVPTDRWWDRVYNVIRIGDGDEDYAINNITEEQANDFLLGKLMVCLSCRECLIPALQDECKDCFEAAEMAIPYENIG